MGRPRSASAPRERGPRAVHKNSPTASNNKQQQVEQVHTQRQESSLYNKNRPTTTNAAAFSTSLGNNNGNNKSNSKSTNNVDLPVLRSLRPGSSNGRPASANGTPRSGCASQRSTHSEDCALHSSRSNSSGSFINRLGLGAEKCVCFICTCGKHHCPPAYRPNPTPLDANTHYSDTYKNHEPGCYPERVQNKNFEYAPTRAAPGHFDTTHKAGFVAPEMKHHAQNLSEKMERSSRPRNQRQEPREVFDHTSVQRQDFPWHNPAPAQPVRPSAESPISAGPFYGLTTNKDTYQGWKPSPEAYERANHAGRNSAHTPFSDDKIEFDTSYTGQFVEHAVPTRSAPKPKDTYSYGSPRTDQFHTQSRMDFAGKQNPVCPAHQLPPRPASARTGHVKYTLDMTGTWS